MRLSIGLLYRLLLPPVLDRVNDDSRPETYDHDAGNHLPRHQSPSALTRGRDVAEPNRGKNGDGEIERIGTGQRLAEIAGRERAQDEVRPGEQQQKQWSTGRESSDRPEHRILRSNNRPYLKGDQSDERQKSGSQQRDRPTTRGAIQRQQVVDREQHNVCARDLEQGEHDLAKPTSKVASSANTKARALSHGERLTTTVTSVGFTQQELQAFRNASVPDLVGPGLTLLFVGINPGLWTAATQTHFAHPGNRFYPALRLAGILDRDLDRGKPMTDQDRAYFVKRGIGITNLVNRATARAGELAPAELRAGRTRLEKFVTEHHPVVVAIAGITAYRVAFAVPKAREGEQAALPSGARIWVVPNPSGLNAHETITSLAVAYAEPARVAGVIT